MPLAAATGPDRACSGLHVPSNHDEDQGAPPGDKQWLKVLARYRDPDLRRSICELLITAVPFFVLWAVMLLCLQHGYWLSLVLAVPAAGFLVRLFMIQHDCGHGSFFRRAAANH